MASEKITALVEQVKELTVLDQIRMQKDGSAPAAEAEA